MLKFYFKLELFCRDNGFNWDNVTLIGILHYLNICTLYDDFQGGETHFPLRNKKIIPVKGKAALFFNLDENNIDKLENSKHAGLPPTSGIKWMCNVWIRQNKIPAQYKN